MTKRSRQVTKVPQEVPQVTMAETGCGCDCECMTAMTDERVEAALAATEALERRGSHCLECVMKNQPTPNWCPYTQEPCAIRAQQHVVLPPLP